MSNMRKFAMTVLLGFIFILSCCQGKEIPKNPDSSTPPVTEEITPPAFVKGFMTARFETVDQSSINIMKSWGAGLIRLQVLPVKNAFKNNRELWESLPDYLNLLKTKVDMAHAAGLKVVTDLHEPMIVKDGRQTTSAYWNTAEFWNREDIKPTFIRFWKQLAELFKDAAYDNVIWGYDIYNEPVENSTIPYKWRAMAPDIIAEIRKIDSNVWIVYEPGPWGDASAYLNMEPLADKRIIYSLHFYSPQSSFTHVGLDFYTSATATREQALAAINKQYPGTLNGKYWDKAALAAQLKAADDFQAKYKVPMYVGEFSVITWVPVASSTQWLKDVTDLFEERKWSWCYHAFREWQGWSLEQPEGIEAFWFSRDGAPPTATTETERAKVIKAALKK